MFREEHDLLNDTRLVFWQGFGKIVIDAKCFGKFFRWYVMIARDNIGRFDI